MSRSLSFNRKKLDQIFEGDYVPENLVGLFEEDFEDEFRASAGLLGLWEGYSLKQHTLMVLKQFERYFAHKKLPGDIDTNFFRVILTLHDIGKPEAVRNEGKHHQHKYTLKIVEPTLNHLEFHKKDKDFALSLINGDPMGGLLKERLTVQESVERIKEMAGKTKLGTEDFLNLLLVYYKVDAGSYTKDAGGFKSLDRLFVFDHKNKNLHFAPDTGVKIGELKRCLCPNFSQ